MTNYPTISIHTKAGLLFIRQEEILYGQAKGNYTDLFLEDGRQIRVTRQLKEVNQLLNNEMFIRIHHSHFINLNHLVSYHEEKVLLDDGSRLTVSKSRKAYFLELFTRI